MGSSYRPSQLYVVDSQNITISPVWSPLDKTLAGALKFLSSHSIEPLVRQSIIKIKNSWGVQIEEGMARPICDDAPETSTQKDGN